MRMKGISSHRQDVLCIILLSVLLIGMNFVCLGFAQNGLDAPLSYAGVDDFSEGVNIKSIAEHGWLWENTRLGAPYTQFFHDFQASFLMNFENVCTFIITRFIKDPFAAFNIQFLLAIVLCGIISFIVLRQLKISRLLALAGAILYATSPYIYNRAMGHFILGACYFIPLSILLCVWAEQEAKDFLSSKHKIIATMSICLLVANNGAGYYPFFTCFLLCITCLITVLKSGRISRAKAALISICLIVFFMMLSLIPTFVYKLKEGSNNITGRPIADLELYGLKIVQLFLPTNAHHPSFIKNIVAEYNSSAPLVNENQMAYMGVFACTGLVAMMFMTFLPFKPERHTALSLFPKLSIWAMLFFSIGGIISLFCLVTGFRSLRGFNRISIFIAFMSIAALCLLLQNLLELEIIKKNKVVRTGCRALIALFVLYCIWEQHPSLSIYGNALATNKIARQNDVEFVRRIESQMNENDMILQLPYHKYPEAGPVKEMNDYSHFRAYLNSSKLRWSYGGMKGRKSDMWNERISTLPMSRMIPAIAQSGFRGIYIDSRAYAEEELEALCRSIEVILEEEEPFMSGDKKLLFYNLYPYLAKHPELKETNLSDIEYMEWFYPFNGQNISGGFDKDGIRYLDPNGHSFGPYIPLEAGSYTVTIKGKNLSPHFIEVYSQFGNVHHDFTEEGNDDNLLIRFKLKASVRNIEIFIRNDGDDIMEMETFTFKRNKD